MSNYERLIYNLPLGVAVQLTDEGWLRANVLDEPDVVQTYSTSSIRNDLDKDRTRFLTFQSINPITQREVYTVMRIR